MIKPKVIISYGHGTIVGGNVPYNSATIPYNSADILYGGYFIPYRTFNQNFLYARRDKPNILDAEYQYTPGTMPGSVILYAGMPMGLLLDLTYPTTGTIYI